LACALTFKLDPDNVNLNWHTIHLGQRWYRSKVTVQNHRQTHTSETIALPRPQKWSLTKNVRSWCTRCWRYRKCCRRSRTE